jgi:hypothetical protein
MQDGWQRTKVVEDLGQFPCIAFHKIPTDTREADKKNTFEAACSITTACTVRSFSKMALDSAQ